MKMMRVWLAGLAAAGVFAASPALADRVPRTETGVVSLHVSSMEVRVDPVGRGEIFASITGRPNLVARVDMDVNTRARPGPTPGPVAGSFLFGYTLASGVAYCEPLAASGIQQRRQCFRDFNDDGVFDGGYVTSRGGTGLYFVDRVESLVPIAPLPFVSGTPDDLAEVTVQLRLVRVTLDEATIAIIAGDDIWETEGEAVEGQDHVYAFSVGTFRITWVDGDDYRIERLTADAAVRAAVASAAPAELTP